MFDKKKEAVPIPIYDGSTSFDKFIEDFAAYLTLKGYDTEKKAKKHLFRSLEGNARKAFCSLPSKVKNGPWKDLIDELFFEMNTEEGRLFAKMRGLSLKQGDTSVIKFHETCRSLAYQAYPGRKRQNEQDAFLYECFMKGLSSHIAYHVCPSNPTDPNEAFDLAQLAETMIACNYQNRVNALQLNENSDDEDIQIIYDANPLNVPQPSEDTDIITLSDDEDSALSTPRSLRTPSSSSRFDNANKAKRRSFELKQKRKQSGKVTGNQNRRSDPLKSGSNPLESVSEHEESQSPFNYVPPSIRNTPSTSQCFDNDASPFLNDNDRSKSNSGISTPASSFSSYTPRSERNSAYRARKAQRHQQLQEMTERSVRSRRKDDEFEFDLERMKEKEYFKKAVEVVRKFIADEIGKVRKQIENQLDYEVAGPDNMTIEEKKRRQLCRIPIHIYKGVEDGKVYDSVSDVYKRIWRVFMGYFDITNIDDVPEEMESQMIAKEVINEIIDKICSSTELSPTHGGNDDMSRLSMDARDRRAKKANVAACSGNQEPISKAHALQYSKDVDDLLIDVYGDAVNDVGDVETEYRQSFLEQCTRARQCDEDCPVIDACEAATVYDRLAQSLNVVNGSVEEFKMTEMYYLWNDEAKSVAEWFHKYFDCCQGLRSLRKRFNEVAHLVGVVAVCDRVLEDDDYMDMENFMKLDNFPNRLRMKFFEMFAPRKCEDHHMQDHVESVYGRIIEKFHEVNEQQERAVCDVCKMYKPEHHIRKSIPKEQLSDKIDEDVIEEFQLKTQLDICQMCWKAKKMPGAAVSNGFQPQDVPSELSCLNHIERMLIELKRANMKVFLLKSVAKKTTAMKGTKGVLVVLPTHIESTINHVEKCLPSGSNMVIDVRLPWGKRTIVSMPRVVRALEWLKENNVQYKDIEINKRFSFELNTNIFLADPNAVQKDADDLLIPCDNGNEQYDRHDVGEREQLANEQQDDQNETMENEDSEEDDEDCYHSNFHDGHILTQEVVEADSEEDADECQQSNFQDDLIVTQDEVEADMEENADECQQSSTRASRILTEDEVEEQPIQPVHQRNDSELAMAKFALSRHLYNPTSIDTPDLDVQIFPQLHPYGNDGMNAERETEVGQAKYIRTRLLSVDRRWATNANYLCYLYGRKQQLALTSVQGIQARVKYGTKSKDYDLSDEKVQKEMTSAYAKIRGFPQYWKRVKYELRAHVAAFGTPTWFLTLNPNTKGWTDLHRLYETILGVKVTKKNIDTEIIPRDPTIFARYWRKRVDAFWKNVLLAPDGPLGEITHYFYRVEYQHRGTQHIHCVLWTRNRPAADAPSSEVEDFIDKYVTARLPDEDDEPDLFKLVNEQQRHWKKHSNTCRRKIRYKNRWTTSRCRFGYPKPNLRRTFFYKGNDQRFRVPGVANRPYYLARRRKETMINDYNAAILLAWSANIDLQFIPADATDVVNYVTAYTTKGEKAKRMSRDNMKRYSMEGLSRSKVLFKIGLDILNQREVGLLEIVDDLLGHANYKFDTAHVFIPTDPRDTRARILCPKDKVQPNEVCHQTSWVDDYYPNRDATLRDHSLYNVMANFLLIGSEADKALVKKKKKQPQRNRQDWESDDEIENDDEDRLESRDVIALEHEYDVIDPRSPFYYHPNMSSGDTLFIKHFKNKRMRKMKQNLPRFFLPHLIRGEVKIEEDYYRRLVMLFVPWTDETKILDTYEVTTYCDVWLNYLKRLRLQSQSAWEDLTKLIAGYTQLQNEELELSKRMDRIRRAMETLQIEEEEEDNLVIQTREVNIEKHESAKLALNTVQRQIFERVIATLTAQDEVMKTNERIRKENEERLKNGQARLELVPMPPPIQMFVSGTAGTGKSFLINTLADEITLLFGKEDESSITPAVLLDAPTGKAALNINGNTIHSLLGIEVVQTDHRYEEEFQPLSGPQFDKRKLLFSNMRLKITDEISMVSNVQFMKMHKRMQEISGKHSELFGDYNVIMFGDLMQLPPVKAPNVFMPIPSTLMRNIFGTINIHLNLWQCLEYMELTENMRQGDDGELAKLFERIRTGMQTAEDIQILISRCIVAKNGIEPTIEEIADCYIQLLAKDPTTMALFALLDEVNAFNAVVLKKINLTDTITLDATDSIDYSATRAAERGPTKKKKPWRTFLILRSKKKKNVRNDEQQVDDMVPSGATFCNSKMQGGLPHQLTIGVGARVMLRRNISIRDRLVNGATGVVEKFIRNDGGEVTHVSILFDGTENEIAIRKESATFKHQEETMVRVQFPLVVAYGATIHKSQGLTLTNVLVRSRNIFSNGMFYVAVSRITKLEGLHLAGFSAAKIMYDPAALAECNRLRKTLPSDERPPPLLGGPQNQRSRADEYTTERVANDGSLQQDVHLNRRGRNTRRVFDIRQTVDELLDLIPDVQPDERLHSNKFAEANVMGLIHLLAMMEHVHVALMQYDSSKTTGKKPAYPLAFEGVLQCLKKVVTDVFEIVSRNGNFDFIDNIEMCTNSFFEDVLPEEILNMFTREFETEGKCSRCKNNKILTIRRSILWIQNNNCEGAKLNEHIDTELSRSKKSDEKCSIVFPDGTVCEEVIEYEEKIGSKSRYLLVGQVDGHTSSYAPLPQDAFPIGDSRFLLAGAVSLGNPGAVYDDDNFVEAFYKNPTNGWTSLDCGGDYIQSKDVKLQGKHFFVFVEKPKERLTEKDKQMELAKDRVVDYYDFGHADDDDIHRDLEVSITSDEDEESIQQENQVVQRPVIPLSRHLTSGSLSPSRSERVPLLCPSVETPRRSQYLHGSDASNRPPRPPPPRRNNNTGVMDTSNRPLRPPPPRYNNNNHNNEFLLLPNRSSDCFLNTAVNMLYSCRNFRDVVNRSQLNTPICKDLRQIFSGERRDVYHLREHLGARFNQRLVTGGLQQNDTNDCLLTVLRELEETEGLNINCLMKVYYTQRDCNNPSCIPRHDRGIAAFSTVIMGRGHTLQESINRHQDSTNGCHYCDATVYKLREQQTVDSIGEYHIVELVKEDPQQTFSDFRVSDRVNMFGFQWDLIAFSHFTGGHSGGHYTSFMKQRDSKWKHINDDFESATYEQESLNLRHLSTNTLVFRKCEPENNNSAARSIYPTLESLNGDGEPVTKLPRRIASPIPYSPPTSSLGHHPSKRTLVDDEVVLVENEGNRNEGRHLKTSNVEPQPKKIKVTKSKLRSLKKSELGIDLEDKTIEFSILRLENGDQQHNCSTINAILNMMYGVDSFRLTLVRNRQNYNGIARMLADLFSKDVTRSTVELRNALDVQIELGDINAVFKNIIKKLINDGETLRQFCTIGYRTAFCLNCNFCWNYPSEETLYWSYLMMPKSRVDFAEMIGDVGSVISDCDACLAIGKKTTMCVPVMTSNYHFVVLQNPANRKLNLSMYPGVNVKMHDADWELISFAALEEAGHNVWMKTENTWVCVFGLEVQIEKEHHLMDLGDYVLNLLLFRKVLN